MSQQIINLGTGPDTQTGDSLYTAFTKVNDNFTELYSVFDGNGISEINANTITANNISLSTNVRTGNLFAYGNIESIGYIVTSGVFYPNGQPINGLTAVDSNILPAVSNVYSIGDPTHQFTYGYFSKDVTVGGNLIAANLIANSVLVVQDPLLYLTANTPYPYNYEIGFYSQFQTGPNTGYQHSGLARDHTDNTWKLFSNIVDEPSGSGIDFTNAVYDDLLVGNLTSVNSIWAESFKGNFEGNITGNITAAGNDQQVMFNQSGSTAGSAGLRYDYNNQVLVAANLNAGTSNIFIVNGQRVGINTSSFIDGAILQIHSTDSILLPVGDSDSRPGNAQPGMLRYNTVLSDIEYFNGDYWAAPITQFTLSVANAQPGTGTETSFNLPVGNATTAGTIVSINGIVQQPVTAYSISGNVVTFTEAPSPEDIIDFRIFTTTSTLTGLTDVYGTTGIYIDDGSVGSQTIEFRNNNNPTLTLTANGQAYFQTNIRSDNFQTGAIVVEGGMGIRGNVNINGIMYAVAKNFLIDHPTKNDYKLQYSCLEGPEYGVYVRGRLQESNTIELPYYWKDLVDEQSITVTLTPYGNYQELFVKKIENNNIYLENRTGEPINCFYVAYAERKDLSKLTIEYKG